MRGETRMVLKKSPAFHEAESAVAVQRPAVRGRDVPSVQTPQLYCAKSSAYFARKRIGGEFRFGWNWHRNDSRCGRSEALNDIFSNLVVNALEATTSGGAISRSSLPPTARVWSTLRDDGPGIPIAVREKNSSAVFTTKFAGTVWVWPLWRAALPSAMENLRVEKSSFETDAARDLKSVCPLLRRLYEDN